MYADYIQLLRNINKNARANRFVNTSETQKTNLEDSRKSHHSIQRRAYHSRQSPTDSPVRGQEVGENTQSRTKGSYIYDVESCHIRTLTIYLENGLNRLRDST